MQTSQRRMVTLYGPLQQEKASKRIYSSQIETGLDGDPRRGATNGGSVEREIVLDQAIIGSTGQVKGLVLTSWKGLDGSPFNFRVRLFLSTWKGIYPCLFSL
jgi:hypothetical protein